MFDGVESSVLQDHPYLRCSSQVWDVAINQVPITPSWVSVTGQNSSQRVDTSLPFLVYYQGYYDSYR